MTNNPLIPQSKLSTPAPLFLPTSAPVTQIPGDMPNLSQGFPGFDGLRYYRAKVTTAVVPGGNHIRPTGAAGPERGRLPRNRTFMAGYQPDADSDITVTAAGATEALYAAITALESAMAMK